MTESTETSVNAGYVAAGFGFVSVLNERCEKTMGGRETCRCCWVFSLLSPCLAAAGGRCQPRSSWFSEPISLEQKEEFGRTNECWCSCRCQQLPAEHRRAKKSDRGQFNDRDYRAEVIYSSCDHDCDSRDDGEEAAARRGGEILKSKREDQTENLSIKGLFQ